MNGVDNLYKNIYKGKDGKNIGISTGLPKLDSVIFGIQQKYLYTIGADSGSGKTAVAIYSFVYELIKNAGDKPMICFVDEFDKLFISGNNNCQLAIDFSLWRVSL